LLLDEIDSINKRSDDFTGGQQHINRLVNVLLTKLENAPEGSVIILCTNRVEALDPAINRRLTMKLHFEPAQTEKQRMKLWQVHLKDIPLEGKVEEVCSALAASYPMLSHGGHIKQVVMTSVRRATMREKADHLSMSHLKDAAEGIIQQLDLKQKKKMGFSS
jgi:ATP-dependent 26S proteasome regulatory subunit